MCQSKGIRVSEVCHVSALSRRIGDPSGLEAGGRRRGRGIRARRLLAETRSHRDRRPLLPLRTPARLHPCAASPHGRIAPDPGALRPGRCGRAPPSPRRLLRDPARIPASGALRDRGGQGGGSRRRQLPGGVRGRREPLRSHAGAVPCRQPHPARGGRDVGIERPAAPGAKGRGAARVGGHPVGAHPQSRRSPSFRIQGPHPAAAGGGAGDERGLGAVREGHFPALRRHAAEVRSRGDAPPRPHPPYRGGGRLLVPRVLFVSRDDRRVLRGRRARGGRSTAAPPVRSGPPAWRRGPGRRARGPFLRRTSRPRCGSPLRRRSAVRRRPARRAAAPRALRSRRRTTYPRHRSRTASRNPTRTGPLPGIPDPVPR